MDMDNAQVNFNGINFTSPLQIWGISSHCFKCDYQYKGEISSVGSNNFVLNNVDTRWTYKFLFKNDIYNFSKTYHFKEYGKYTFQIMEHATDKYDSSITLLNDPMQSWFPFVMFLVVLVGMSILWPLAKCFYRAFRGLHNEDKDYFIEMEEWEHKMDTMSVRQNGSNSHDTLNSQKSSESTSNKQGVKGKNSQNKSKSKRLRSLDVFRGIAIVSMIFVNNSGGKYYFIEHSIWNGLTFADLVFPWFIFIMGMTMQLSYRSFLKRGEGKLSGLFQILFRSFKLFVIGLVLNSGKNLMTWRIPGVLQRFAICYLIVASLNIVTSPSEHTLIRWSQYRRFSILHDILPFWFQWLFMFAIIGAHTTVTFLLDVPGCPKGYLGPGGLSEGGKYFNCTGGAAGYIDRLILGDKHIYGFPTTTDIYETTMAFDPEGILGFLTSIFLTFLGLQAGRILFMYKTHAQKISRLFVWAVVMGAIGIGLCKASLNDGIIPVNKNLWSLSFVLIMAAISNILFIICYVSCDLIKIWNGSPFFYCGMNAIVLYIMHMLVQFRIHWHEDPQSHTSHLVVAAFSTNVWVVWAFALYRKKLFFTV